MIRVNSSYNLRIYIVCHKPGLITDDTRDIYVPIQAGHALKECELGITADDYGDNISHKNKSYCELTALYWVWKNVSTIDIVGFEHYRRHFILNKHCQRSIKQGKVVLLRPDYGDCRVIDRLVQLTSSEDAVIMIDELLNQYPQWREAVEGYFWRSNRMSVGNMFIMPWAVFDSYASFLFPLLSRLESLILPSNYIRQQRVFGYFGECLLGFWLYANHIVPEYVMGTHQNHIRHIGLRLHEIRSTLAFIISPRNKQLSFHDSIIDGLKTQGYQINSF